MIPRYVSLQVSTWTRAMAAASAGSGGRTVWAMTGCYRPGQARRTASGTKSSPDPHLPTNSCPAGAPRIKRVRANREAVTAVESPPSAHPLHRPSRPSPPSPRNSGTGDVSFGPVAPPPADLELPRGPRTRPYRFFEALPAAISFTAVGLVFILPFVDVMLGAVYVLSIVGLMFVRAMLGAIDVARGFVRFRRSARVDWAARLTDLERALDGRPSLAHPRGGFRAADHATTIEQVRRNPDSIMRPSTLLHAVVVAAFNERYPVIADTIRTLLHRSTKPEQLLVFFAHEERGGPAMAETARRLEAKYGHRFGAFVLVEHPAGLPDEIAGKGANITFAGHRLAEWVRDQAIDPRRVIVTSLDCDNIPHESYFDAVAYEYAIAPDRERLSFQPISLYITNIWDVPAPSRVVASANCFWNLTTTVRRLALRNFASHAQPLTALVEMGFWSKRTIVEDGHQYWRSWFHFDGDYRVVPIHVPIFQDAVLAGSAPVLLPARGARHPRLDLDHHRHRRLDSLRRGHADGAGHLGGGGHADDRGHHSADRHDRTHRVRRGVQCAAAAPARPRPARTLCDDVAAVAALSAHAARVQLLDGAVLAMVPAHRPLPRTLRRHGEEGRRSVPVNR